MILNNQTKPCLGFYHDIWHSFYDYLAKDQLFCSWTQQLRELSAMLFVFMLLLTCIAESHCFRYHGYAYDGIWTIARAIDRVEKESQQANESLVDFNYK